MQDEEAGEAGDEEADHDEMDEGHIPMYLISHTCISSIIYLVSYAYIIYLILCIIDLISFPERDADLNTYILILYTYIPYTIYPLHRVALICRRGRGYHTPIYHVSYTYLSYIIHLFIIYHADIIYLLIIYHVSMSITQGCTHFQKRTLTLTRIQGGSPTRMVRFLTLMLGERDRQTDRQTDKQTNTQTIMERERKRERERERERE